MSTGRRTATIAFDSVLLPNDFVVAQPRSFPNDPSRRGLERPSVTVERVGVAPLGRGNTAPTPVTRNEHALFRLERAPISRSPIGAEPHGPDVWNHDRAARIRRCPAAAWNLEHWTVDELPPQYRRGLSISVRSGINRILLAAARRSWGRVQQHELRGAPAQYLSGCVVDQPELDARRGSPGARRQGALVHSRVYDLGAHQHRA